MGPRNRRFDSTGAKRADDRTEAKHRRADGDVRGGDIGGLVTPSRPGT